MTKCQPLLNMDFILFLCAVLPRGHEDLGNFWRNNVPLKDSQRVDKPLVVTCCVVGVVWAWENQGCVGHTGMIKIPWAWSSIIIV